jgi:hypothetical protein
MSKTINCISIVHVPEVSTQIGWNTQVPTVKVPLKASEIDWTITEDSDSDDEDVVSPVTEVSKPVNKSWADYDTEDEDNISTPVVDTPIPVVDTPIPVMDTPALVVDTLTPVVDTTFATVSRRSKGVDRKSNDVIRSFKGAIDIIHANLSDNQFVPFTNLCHTLGDAKQFNTQFGSFFKDNTKVLTLIADITAYLIEINASSNIKFEFFPEHFPDRNYPIYSAPAFIIYDVRVKVYPPHVTAWKKKQEKTGK